MRLKQPAPAEGMTVHLRSSDANAATVPDEVNIPGGESSATAAIATSPVTTPSTVTITASYGNAVSGTSLRVNPATAAPFTIALQPATITIAPGKSKSTEVLTAVTTGFDHALQLTVSVPAGVHVHFTPKMIPAPGTGDSSAMITVPASGVSGTHSIRVTASDGTTSSEATLTLKVSSADPGAAFQGCWQHQNGHSYQGVRFSVANPGTYPFDAVLYYGTTCNPNDWADEFGFGTPIAFGGFDYAFWFTDFADKTDMSALWHVGSDTSKCVDYKVAPSC